MKQSLPATLGFLCGSMFAIAAGRYLEIDSCLDAGGAFDELKRCQVESGTYVPLFARASAWPLWLLLLASTIAVGGSVRILTRRWLDRQRSGRM